KAIVFLAVVPLAEHEIVARVAAEHLVVHGHGIGGCHDGRAAGDVGRRGCGAAGEFTRSGRGRRRILSPVEAGELELTGGGAAGERRHEGERGENANDTHGLYQSGSTRRSYATHNGWESNDAAPPRPEDTGQGLSDCLQTLTGCCVR